jgi:hypothetical protein
MRYIGSDAEDLRWALKAAIKSDTFSTKLREVWLRKGGTEPRTVVEVYRSQVARHDGYPCCEIDVTIGRNTDNRNDHIDLQYEVHLYWHDKHDNEEELEDFISRYLTAAREFFMENPFLDGIDNPPIIVTDDQFSPFVPEGVYDGRPLLKSGLTIILVEVLRNGRP